MIWAKIDDSGFFLTISDGLVGPIFEISGAHNFAIRHPIKTPLQAWIPPPNTSRINQKRPPEIKQFWSKSTFKFRNILILVHGVRCKNGQNFTFSAVGAVVFGTITRIHFPSFAPIRAVLAKLWPFLCWAYTPHDVVAHPVCRN